MTPNRTAQSIPAAPPAGVSPLTAAAPDLSTVRTSADQACRLMKIMANPDRLLLLCRLSQGEARVGELEADVGVRQPTLSQQLGVLRDEGLVSTRRQGKAIYYRITSTQALAVMEVLYAQFCSSQKETTLC